VRETPVVDSFRVAKVRGMFDVPPSDVESVRITATLPIEERPWKIGLVTGASGTGKSTIARALFPTYSNAGDYEWSRPSIVDDFPAEMSPNDVVGALTAVGLSSPPVWLRPHHVLSTGQQFRADLARALATPGDGPVVFDEYTSTVDRTVARAVSVATAKHVRRTDGLQFVAVTCHKDIGPWLQPDWVYDTDAQAFTWGSVQPRPQVRIDLVEGHRDAWPSFRHHHYMNHALAQNARTFGVFATFGDTDETFLAGFASVIWDSTTDRRGGGPTVRGHRHVVLPDFQGMGIGLRMIETLAQTLWERERVRYRDVTSAPGLVAARLRRPDRWVMTRKPGQVTPYGKTSKMRRTGAKSSAGRLTTSWTYVPEET